MYFDTCNTADECRAKYRELAKQLHPDKGGTARAFQTMQSEYEQRLAELIKGTRANSIEYAKLVKALLELLKVTKPEYYELVKLYGNHPTVGIISQLITELFPKTKNITEILKLIQ